MPEHADSVAARAARTIGRVLGCSAAALLPVRDPLEQLRLGLQRSTQRLLAGTEQRERADLDAPGGYFPPDAVVRIVHADASMLIGGLRALLLQTLHPLVIAGVAEHSDYRDDPLGRLHRTGNYVGVTTFGQAEEAERMIRMIRKIHIRVQGIAPDGRPYSATDPHLLRWVHITEVDSFLRAFRTYGATKITPRQADQYVAEMARVAVALGATDVPTSVAELDECLVSYRPELRVSAQTTETVGFLVNPPIPFPAKAAYPVIAGAAVTLLPGYARRYLKLPVLPLAEPLLVRPAATVLVRTLGWAMEP